MKMMDLMQTMVLKFSKPKRSKRSKTEQQEHDHESLPNRSVSRNSTFLWVSQVVCVVGVAMKQKERSSVSHLLPLVEMVVHFGDYCRTYLKIMRTSSCIAAKSVAGGKPH
jgi:predicted histidine transporter YuiF (NhaC family)